MKAKEFIEKIENSLKNRQDVEVKKYPLKYKKGEYDLLRVVSKDILPKDKVVIIRAGIHGEETAGPLTLLKNISSIFDYAHLNQVKLIVYPLANPSGFEMGKRDNIDEAEGEGLTDDFIYYELKNGKIVDDIRNKNDFKKWSWVTDLKMSVSLENELMNKLLRKDPLEQIVGAIDLHQNYFTPKAKAGAYQHAYPELWPYKDILDKIKRTVPILRKFSVDFAPEEIAKTDNKGFIVRYDGSFSDLMFRLGAKYSVAPVTTAATPLDKAMEVNLAWIYGVLDLVRRHSGQNPKKITMRELVKIAQADILPKKITPQSRINVIFTSSPISDEVDVKDFTYCIDRLKKEYPNSKVFDVKKSDLVPEYLTGSEKERLRRFRQARKRVDMLQPSYGGIGCGDIIRHLTSDDLRILRKNRPVVNGFSDTTFLINYLYFKLKLLTFHYCSAGNLYILPNHQQFWDVITGKLQNLEYFEKGYSWFTEKPESPIEGIAIGGNLTMLRVLFDLVDINVKSWRPFILFLEETEVDIEDLHYFVLSLDQKGLFKNVRAIVLGKIEGEEVVVKKEVVTGTHREISNKLFGYILDPVISNRRHQKDPLYVLRVTNLGHKVDKPMIIPIGAKTIIHPDGRIEFKGPFVQ